MDYSIRLVHPDILYFLIPVLIIASWFVYAIKKRIVFNYSLGSYIKDRMGAESPHPYQKILYCLRFIFFLILVLLIAHPQLVDYRSQVQIDGIDIMLVLDVSGTMNQRDFEDDARSRVDIAKDEAIRFIEKRTNDALGLVIFGKDIVSRCPLTQDKKMLVNMVKELKIGIIDYEGTKLASALITAANRLKNAQSKSKVIILLTDGAPSEDDMNPETAIMVAQKLGIKIYTIGIGDDQERVIMHPFYGLIPMPTVNTELLKKIAQDTGGAFFMAKNARDMRTIYQEIDALETTKHETVIFNNYYELGIPGILLALALMAAEIVLSTFIWFGL